MMKSLIKTYNVLLVLTGTLLIYSCTNKSNEKGSNADSTNQRIAFPEAKSENPLSKIRPETQKKEIKTEKDTTISGTNGTQIFIPQNSFVDTNGQPVKGNVQIEMIEVLTVSDVIKSNLQTISNGHILETEGMVYINATANGEPVSLGKDKKLQIEMPIVNKSKGGSEIKIFSGSYDSKGNMNWVESGKKENKMIAIPWELMWVNSTYSNPLKKHNLNKSKYENTYISTREFEKRIGMYLGMIIFDAFRFFKEEESMRNDAITKDTTILNTYLKNTDKPLWYSDSIIYNMVIEKYKNDEKVNPKSYNDKKALYDLMFQNYKAFYDERLTTVIKLNYQGVDLNKADARKKLSKQGLSSSAIDEVLGAYQRQQKIITQRSNMVKAEQIVSNTFSTSKIGWINCDRFYNVPTAKESNIRTTIKGFDKFETMNLSLVFNERKIALRGNIDNNGIYTFTGKSSPYTKLPIGEKATIIALSYKNDKPYLGLKEIIISEAGNFPVELKEMSMDEIESKLKWLN